MVFWEVASRNKAKVHQNRDIWCEIEEHRNITSSMPFIDNSASFTYETSVFPERDITGLILDMEMAVVLEDSLFHFIVDQGAHVNVWNLNNNFKSNEVDDAVLDGVLICQHVDIQEFGNEVNDVRGMSDCEG